MSDVERKLDLDRKDWREHLDKVVRLGGKGSRFTYWEGATDVDPRGKRKEVFEEMMGYSEAGKVHLMQRCVDAGVYQYMAELR